MRKSLPLTLALLLSLVGCATQRPPVASCPPPPQLPALAKLPQSVTAGDFLAELETVLLGSQSDLKKSDFSLQPANRSMTGLERR